MAPHQAATSTLPPQGTPSDEELTFISAPKARSYVKALTQVEVRLYPVAEGRGLLLGGTLCKDRAWFRAALAATDWVLHPLLPPVPCPWPYSLPSPHFCPPFRPAARRPVQAVPRCQPAGGGPAGPHAAGAHGLICGQCGPADQHAGVVLMQHPLLP